MVASNQMQSCKMAKICNSACSTASWLVEWHGADTICGVSQAQNPGFHAIVDTSPHTLVLPLCLPIVLALLVLRLLILLASAMPLAMTMRIHIGSRMGPTRVMLSCFTLQGHTQLPCTSDFNFCSCYLPLIDVGLCAICRAYGLLQSM